MAADSQIQSLALQDILLSIAEGLNKAQNELNNMPPYDEYGRPNTIYHLPYLDFSLQVVSEFAEVKAGVAPTGITSAPAAGGIVATPKSAARSAKSAVAAIKPAAAMAVPAAVLPAPRQERALIRFMPVQTAAPVDTSTKNTSRIESTISGRFVAVVPNEGLPQVFIATETTSPRPEADQYRFAIKATVKNAANEVLANTRVEFNFDEATSNSLSSIPIANRPRFSKNEGLTDATGTIAVEVWVNATDFNNGASFCFVINSSNIQKNISVSK
jgi:hypothetical protein